MFKTLISSVSTLMITSAVVAGTTTTIVTFDNGDEGWKGPQGFGGQTVIDPDGGNPGANLHTTFDDFGVTFRNADNPSFVMDYTAFDTVTLSVDLKVNELNFLGLPTPRPWLVELRDFESAQSGYPWASVWYYFDVIAESATPEYVTYSVTITDTNATELPEGWGGSGAEDPQTFEPILPEGVTFADILAGVDEVVFTTLQPGYFFSNSLYDMQLDNFTIVTTTGGSGCSSDLDGDGMVDGADLGALLSDWGRCAGCASDLNGDGVVDGSDLGIMLGAWGPCL